MAVDALVEALGAERLLKLNRAGEHTWLPFWQPASWVARPPRSTKTVAPTSSLTVRSRMTGSQTGYPIAGQLSRSKSGAGPFRKFDYVTNQIERQSGDARSMGIGGTVRTAQEILDDIHPAVL